MPKGSVQRAAEGRGEQRSWRKSLSCPCCRATPEWGRGPGQGRGGHEGLSLLVLIFSFPALIKPLLLSFKVKTCKVSGVFGPKSQNLISDQLSPALKHVLILGTEARVTVMGELISHSLSGRAS